MSIKRIFAVSLLLALVSSMATTFVSAQTGDKLPPIGYTEYKLKNGLTVVMHPDHSTPIVAVNVWYHVGSKNEATGRTGFAHLFEHMMFQGSQNYVDGWRAVDELGGNVNGTTDQDRTYYYEVVPSNYLERALYMEADRMGNLLGAMSQEKLDNQRDVVKNERRQRVDNVPYGTASERIDEIMYPDNHPYHHSVIGSMEDLSAASLDDVKGFFRQYYVPNNAVLVLAGDYNEKDARAWVQKYFGAIAKGAPINRPNQPEPKLDGIVRKVYEDNVPLPRLSLVWHGVAQYAQDEAALDMLSSILTTGRGSRLQSNLVYGKELAQNIGAFNGTSEIGGLFQITALARPGKSTDDIEKEINSEIERLKKEPPTTEEMTRALNIREASAIYNLQTVLGKGGQLSSYAGYLNKPNYFQSDIDRYRRVTPADVSRVANQYLTANHLVITYVPRTSKDTMPPMNMAANKPTSTATKKKDAALIAKQDAMLPKGKPDPKFTLPAIQKTKLSNGMNVWIVQQRELPIVSMNMVLNGGGILDPNDKPGVASYTANMLNQGTKTRSALDIANRLQSIGASVGAGASFDSTSVSMQTLTKNLDAALDVYADEIVNPSFPDKELDTIRRRALVGFLQRKSNPSADVVYNRVLYGNQPYGRELGGNEKSVKALSRTDLVNFYNANYHPNGATLIVTGDVDQATLMPKLERAFANWKPGTVQAAMTEPEETMIGKPGIYFVDKPGAAQSSVSIGQVGVSRDNPDYYAIQVMNSILGGGGTARLFMNLREDKGYTYGAYSRFSFRRGAGPFSASGEIQTGSTKEAITEFVKELNGIRGTIPVTPQELETNKQALIRRFPAGFETDGQISAQLSNLVTYNLPDTYFNEYIAKVNAVTLDDVNRVANKYLTPDKMVIVIVGDRKVVEPTLSSLGYNVSFLDADGNPLIVE